MQRTSLLIATVKPGQWTVKISGARTYTPPPSPHLPPWACLTGSFRVLRLPRTTIRQNCPSSQGLGVRGEGGGMFCQHVCNLSHGMHLLGKPHLEVLGLALPQGIAVLPTLLQGQHLLLGDPWVLAASLGLPQFCQLQAGMDDSKGTCSALPTAGRHGRLAGVLAMNSSVVAGTHS